MAWCCRWCGIGVVDGGPGTCGFGGSRLGMWLGSRMLWAGLGEARGGEASFRGAVVFFSCGESW